MIGEKTYKNGQIVSKLENDRLTYYFKTGIVKAEGAFLDGLMEGEWRFFREDGQLWQVGHFWAGEKHGSWIRYDRNGQVEYDEQFVNGKKGKKP
jgi:antitoxin component YwqK of YwqJK toxin-antitoxin module